VFELKMKPRFSETDALGHINNTSVPMWFEQGREPLFEFFVPTMKPEDWNLIIARIEVDFLAQLEFRHEVTIKTWLSKMGNSSMQITQEAWQEGKCCARGKAAMIHFDYETNTAAAIPDDIRQVLESHLVED